MCRIVMRFVVLVAVLGLRPEVLGTQECLCIWVDPKASLQAQIDAAPPGSTLCLPEGTWSENIVLNKPLTLRGRGPGRTIIQAYPTMFRPVVLRIQGARMGPPFSVMIEGLSLLGRPATTGGIWGWADTADAGLLVEGTAQVLVHNCHIVEALHGIFLQDSAQALVSSTTILGKKRVLRPEGTGIFLSARTQATVLESTVAQVADGIVVDEHAQVTVYGSAIQDTVFGVHVADDGQAIITHTRIAKSRDGVVLTGRAQANIAHCTIIGIGSVGVALAHHASAVLQNNLVAETGAYGVLLSYHDPRVWFAGFICGAGNVIPGPDEPGGNSLGSVYPDTLLFLTTKEGGVYPER